MGGVGLGVELFADQDWLRARRRRGGGRLSLLMIQYFCVKGRDGEGRVLKDAT